jgi:hypothetical protein
VLAGIIVWPHADSPGRRAAADGVVGERGTRIVWAVLWIALGALWLLPANRAANAVRDAITNAPSGAAWLTSIHSSLAAAAAGRGLAIAIVAATLSATEASQRPAMNMLTLCVEPDHLGSGMCDSPVDWFEQTPVHVLPDVVEADPADSGPTPSYRDPQRLL